MPESLTTSKKLQWKWVGITIVLYAVFYLLPLFLLGDTSPIFTGVWFISGIIIIAAVSGYLSEGVTILEPAIAGAGLVLLFFLGALILNPPRVTIFQLVVPLLMVVVTAFLLSLLGAWLGERAQKLWKTKTPESI
jgi:hypothetical protein